MGDVQNVVLPGIRVGAISTAVGGTVAAVCGIGEIGRRFSESGAAVATGGMLVNVQTGWRCSGLAGVATHLVSVIALSSGAPNGAGTFSKKAELEANAGCIVALKDVGGTNGKTGQNDVTAKFAKADLNTFYYQAGFYDTVTPQFNQDALHANSLEGADVQESDMMAVMGGRQANGGYLYTSYVGGDEQQLFGGLKDVASRGHGNGRRTALTALTSSLLVGSQGKAKTGVDAISVLNTFSEHMDKYAYVGRGFDRLTVTPQPDAMDSMNPPSVLDVVTVISLPVLAYVMLDTLLKLVPNKLFLFKYIQKHNERNEIKNIIFGVSSLQNPQHKKNIKKKRKRKRKQYKIVRSFPIWKNIYLK